MKKDRQEKKNENEKINRKEENDANEKARQHQENYKRINSFSRNIEKDLEEIGYKTNQEIKDNNPTNEQDNKKNQMFLKTIIENVIRIETKIKTVQQEMQDIQIKTNNDKMTIDNLNYKIQQIEKHNNEMQKELNHNRQQTNNHTTKQGHTETGQPNLPQKPQDQPTRNRTYLPPKVLSPGVGDHADPGQEPELTWAKVTTRRYKPKVNIPADIVDNIVDEYPEYREDNNDENRDKYNYTDRETEILEQQMEKSAKIIGLKPILKKDIITEKN